MKQSILSLLIITFLVPTLNAKDNFNREKPFSHKIDGGPMYLHFGDPDWKEVWHLQYGVAYQIGYKRYFIKGRSFSLNGPFQGKNSYGGISYFLYDPNSPGVLKVKDGSVINRTLYRTYDLFGSFALVSTSRHQLLLGLGGSHRKGTDEKYIYNPRNNVPDILDSERIHISEWGAIAEASYSVSFLRYAVVSADLGYRVYPHSTSMFTAGIGLGIQVKHVVPGFLKK
jgi:hypothetical protein